MTSDVVSVTAFVTNTGGRPLFIAEGERFAADDPLVLSSEGFWAPADSTPAERVAARERVTR